MNEEIKKCVICGDKASGNNFNAMTCESCKAFFRRNALKSMEFQCSLRGNCQINLISRKYCRSCRLRKCLSMGMKKEYILSDELKQLRRIKRSNKIVAENTIDFTTGNSCDESVVNQNANQDVLSEIFGDKQNIINEEIGSQVKEIENYISDKEMNSISDVVYRKAVEFDFAVIPIPRPITDTKTFGELEGYRLSELLNATNILINPLTDNKITYEVKDMVEAQREWCRNFEKEIPKYVKSAKVLGGFKTLCDNDKNELMKYGSIEIFCLRLITLYNEESDSLVYNHSYKTVSQMKVNVLKAHKFNMFPVFRKFLQSIVNDWESDPVILNLLTAIILFNDERPNLLDKELVKLQQHVYMYLLQRYLLMRYESENEAKLKLLRFMNGLHDVFVLREILTKSLSKDRPSFVGPLLREILHDFNTQFYEFKYT